MLSDYVDIGGECFNVTGTMERPSITAMPSPNATKTYDFICKSKTEFDKAFRLILPKFPGSLRLIQTYLPYQRPQLEGIKESDKEPLKYIIKERMANIKITMEHSNHTVKNMQYEQYYRNLKKLIKDIDEAEGTSSGVSIDTVRKRIKDNFPKERVYYVLMEMAYYLLHPEQITRNTDDWMKLLDSVETLNLGAIVKSLHDTSQHTMSVDVDRVEKATVLDESTLSPYDDTAELKKRLEAIMQLFVTRKYLKQMARNTKGPIANDDTINLLKSKLPKPMMGGSNEVQNKVKKEAPKNIKISSNAVFNMMTPFFDFFKQKYEPITSVLASAVKVEDISLTSLAKLLFICQNITAQTPLQHGIYRLTHMDPDVMKFLNNQLGAIQDYLDAAKRTDEEKKGFADAVKMIPAVSITSLLNKFGKSGHYTDPDSIPNLRMMLKNINVKSYEKKEDMTGLEDIKNDEQKETIFNEINNFFTVEDLYLVCTESDSIPLNLFEIDYSSVKVSTKECVIQPLTEHYFTTHKEPILTLEQIMDVQSTIVFNHGMLALSTFMESEHLLPK